MPTINEIKDAVYNIALKYGTERVTLFGSYARGEAKPESDIDLHIDKGAIKGLFQLAAFQRELEEKLNTSVDVLTTNSLSERFLKQISREEVVLYEK